MNRNEELIKKLKEIAEVSFRLYDLEKANKYLRLSKGAKRLAELAEEGISADESCCNSSERWSACVRGKILNHIGK